MSVLEERLAAVNAAKSGETPEKKSEQKQLINRYL